MTPNIIEKIFYSAILFAIIWHFIYLLTIFRFHKKIAIAFERNNACKIYQTEGETVRYSTWKAFKHDDKY